MYHAAPKLLKRIALALGGVVMVASAHAGMIGNTATCSITPTPLWVCNTPTAVISDPGEEFRLLLVGNAFFGVDFNDNSLTLTLISNGGLGMGAGEFAVFGGLTGASAVNGFSSVGESGFDLSDVSFAAGTLSLDLNNSDWRPGDTATITFDVARVPAPGTLALVVLGLAALSRRRRA